MIIQLVALSCQFVGHMSATSVMHPLNSDSVADELTSIQLPRRIAMSVDHVTWISKDGKVTLAQLRDGAIGPPVLQDIRNLNVVALVNASRTSLGVDKSGNLVAHDIASGNRRTLVSQSQRRAVGLKDRCKLITLDEPATKFCFIDDDSLVVLTAEGQTVAKIPCKRGLADTVQIACISKDASAVAIAQNKPPFIIVYSLSNGKIALSSDDRGLWMPSLAAFSGHDNALIVGRVIYGPRYGTSPPSCLYTCRQGCPPKPFGEGFDAPMAIASTTNAHEWLVGSADGSIAIVDQDDPRKCRKLRAGDHKSGVIGLASAQDGRTCAALLSNDTVLLLRIDP